MCYLGGGVWSVLLRWRTVKWASEGVCAEWISEVEECGVG